MSTAKVLAAVISRLQPDIVLSATESTDGYTGTVAVQIAELLHLPSITFARSVSVNESRVRAERQTEDGFDEIECSLPVVISVTAGVVEPRYPSLKGILAAKSKPIEYLGISELGLSDQDVGAANSRQEVTDVSSVAARGAGEIIVDDGDGAERIVTFLHALNVI